MYPIAPAIGSNNDEAIGVGRMEELFGDIPDRFLLKRPLDLPGPLCEQDLFGLMRQSGSMNKVPSITLLGAGAYNHYIPAVVRHIISRSEFYTAYTPYQAEISQGILQAIYEYQTMIARLTGMQVANASMYDGSTSMAEAAVLAARTLGRRKIIIGRSVHPQYREVVGTYAWANGLVVVEAAFNRSGRLDRESLLDALDTQTAALIIQSPNFFGVVEDIADFEKDVHEKGTLLVAGFTEATSLGILKPAGEMGADFVVGEGQGFGNPLNYGGPYLGIFSSTDKFLRKIPGRLCGATVDKEGRRGFVLTLQTREQHIRREKATSNICSNEALCALAAGVYLACLGKNLKRLAELNVRKAQYLIKGLSEIAGWEPAFAGPVYNEFAMRCPDPAAVNRKLEKFGIIGAYGLGKNYPELGDGLLFCATEMLAKEDMDKILNILS